MIVSSEAEGWMRLSDQVREFSLPDGVKEARKSYERVERDLKAVTTPLEVPSVTSLMAQGKSLERAQATHEKAAKAEEQRGAAYQSGKAAADVQRHRLNKAVKEARDELVLSIRDLVTATIAEARPHAAELAPLGRGFSTGDLVHRGTPKMLRAFQKVSELERRFGLMISAWRDSWRAAATRPGSFDVREVPQGIWFFEAPELVEDDALAGRKLNKRGRPVAIQPNVLSLASEDPAVGFRLLTLGEAEEAHAASLRARREADAQGRRYGVGVV